MKKDQGKMVDESLKVDNFGNFFYEVKKGGRIKKFPDLSGDGKVTMKDVLMGRGVIKKPKKKKDGGSVFQKARELIDSDLIGEIKLGNAIFAFPGVESFIQNLSHGIKKKEVQ